MARIDKPEPTLSPRSRQVLFATIAEYVSYGKPVSSRSIVEKHSLGHSAATVRRELNGLTKHGYLSQPHTSAGRIPTDLAFRYFADILKTEAGQIDNTTRSKLAEGFGNLIPGGSGSWQDVVRLLADITTQAALVVTPALSDAVLQQLRFIPCGTASLLAVIVTREGLVHNAYVNPRSSVPESDLERIHNYLGSIIEGKTLNEVRTVLRGELEDARTRRDALREQATLLGTEAIQSSMELKAEIIVDGRSHLLAHPDLKDQMDELLRFLEEKTRILSLLDKTAETDPGPTVIIGEEVGDRLEGCAIITSPFGDSTNSGRVGVIGSMRMNYPALIPLVALASQFLSAHILGNND